MWDPRDKFDSEPRKRIENVGGKMKGVPDTIRGRLRALVRFLFGPEKNLTIRFGLLATVVSTVLLAIGGAFYLVADPKVVGSTETALRFFFTWIRNFHLWAAIALVVGVLAWEFLYRRLARTTANNSRFDYDTVLHLGREVRSTDGVSVLYGDAEDNQQALAHKLLATLDDQLSTGLAHEAANERAVTTDIDEATDESGLVLVDENPGGVSNEVSMNQEGEDSDATSEDGQAEASATRDAVREWLAIVFSSFNVGEVILRFITPMALTIFVIFLGLQRAGWQPYVYVMILIAGLFVGTLSYTGHKWIKRRRLSRSRNRTPRQSSDTVPALAKAIETHPDDPNGYVVWMSGRRYFDYDPYRLAKKVSLAWYCRLQDGYDVPPLIQQKFARDVARMDPLIESVRDDGFEGRAAMLDDLIRVLNDAEDPPDMMPKHELARKASRLGYGVGHDPVLLGEVYEDLYPEIFAEKEVTLTDAHGDEHSVTMVHFRTRPVEVELAELRSDHSESIIPPTDPNPAYQLPDVERPSIQDDPMHSAQSSATAD